MKTIILSLVAGLMINTGTAYACTITPLGDTRLRIEALLNAFDQMETLEVLTSASMDKYHVVTFNHSTQKREKRTYQVIDTSSMCPIYEAREIK